MAVNFVEQIDDLVAVRNVLISVSDKAGLEALVRGLLVASPGVKLYSTGGTHASIRGFLGEELSRAHLVSVSDYTGQPEMQGGLVKTLDFKIYLGLLSETYNDAHQQDLARTQAVAMDLVVVNLYPFRQAVAAVDATVEKARANIDIGGPCMVRASAKNYLRVASLTDPADYPRILEELRARKGRLCLQTRFELARKAFRHTADYDQAIAQYLAGSSLQDVRRCYRIVNCE